MKAIVHPRVPGVLVAVLGGQWKPLVLGIASAGALIALFFTLDHLAGPNDISAGTGFAAAAPSIGVGARPAAMASARERLVQTRG